VVLDQAVADGGGEARGRGQARLGLVVVLAGSALFVAATSYVNWVKYATLRSTYPTDLASFNNPMLNFALGRDRMYLPTATWFSPGDHDGPSLYRSSHFTPLRLFLLPPLYTLWPHVSFLMVVQSALIASGAIALYAFAVRRTGLRWTGFVLAGSFLLHPVVLHMAFNDFREIQLGVGPALFALAAHAEARWGRFAAAALLMLAARVEYAFLLALFPLLNWRLAPPGQRGRAFWLVPTAVALVWYALGGAYHGFLYGVPVPHLAPSGPLSAAVPEGLLGRVPAFLGLMLAPGAAALLTPEGFAAALPFVAAARRVTAAHTLPLHHLQHLSPAVAATMWAFASSLVRLAPGLTAIPRRRSVVAGGLALAAGLSFAPFAWAVSRTYLVGGARHLRLDQVDAALPLDATVLAAPRLAARFSGHARLLSYRALPAARGAARSREEMTQRLLAVADLVVTEREPWLDELVARSGRFQPPVAAAGANLFLVRPGVGRPADADCALEEILGWRQMEPRRLRWIELCEPYFTGK
jgi:hypothetical protein